MTNRAAALTAAQAYLAAYVLPLARFAPCRQQVLHALRSMPFAEQVAMDRQD